MLTMTLADAAASMGGRLLGADAVATGASTDTRKALSGTLFFALKGVNHDGHDHARSALQAGAAAVVVSRDDAAFGEPRIVVDDTLLALGQLARAWRERSAATVIAITGNSGKTTTKEMTAAVLRGQGDTLATQGNLNNEIGVPLTLLQLNASHRFAVIEMGQGRPHDIAYLVEIARPDIALVTNVTGAHLAGFGSLEAIAAGKAEVYSRLAASGLAIINADDAFAALWRSGLPACRVMTFGKHKDAQVRAEKVTADETGCAHFVLCHNGTRSDVILSTPGIHNVANALAAAAIGIACGADVPQIAVALGSVRPVAGRMTVSTLPGGARLIDDTYNANPGSVKAAIDTLCGYAGRRVLVLGHMAELGPDAPALHHDVGAHASAAGVDALFVTGEFANDTANGFGRDAQVFSDINELSAAVVADLTTQGGGAATVLVKGSRSARMERVVMALTGEKNASLAH